MIEKDARMVEIGTMGSVMAQQLDEPLSLTHLLLKRILSDLGGPSASEAVTSSLEKSLSGVSKSIEILDRFRSAAQISGQTIIAPVDLAIAKEIIRARDGNIAAESHTDHGTTFRVILPVQHVY